jgi:hypothetical protein
MRTASQKFVASSKEEHPDWTDEQLVVKYDKMARFNGACMLLSDDGIKAVQRVITKNINKDNILQLAAMKSSNSSEKFWMCATVHSEGKRLNLAQTDAWESVLYGVVGQKSLKQKYPQELALWLGITGENAIFFARQEALQKRQDKDKIRKSTPIYMRCRKATKLMAAGRVKKEAKKKESYKFNKVPLASVTKMNNDGGRPKKKRKCGNCGLPGHSRNSCPQPGQQKAATVWNMRKADNDMDFLDILE